MAFGKGEPQYGSKARDAGTSPELRAPTGFGNEVEVNDSGDEVSTGVSLLHNSASKTASLDRKVFKGRGRSQTPDTSHTNAEKSSNGEELVKGLNEATAQGERRDEEEIGDQRPLSTKPIRNEAEDNLLRGWVRDLNGKLKVYCHPQRRRNGIAM